MKADGHSLAEALCFLDDGISGATLMRPGLERLRDIAYAGGLHKLYVHSPDRLARKYAWQVLLVDELQSHGVEIVFLNHTPGASPEEDLLLQMQGMFAEYERAKILERSRRGKRHAAKRGSVNVLSGAPYGSRYLTRQEGNGVAAYEVIEEQAAVVKQVFEWVGCDRLSIGEVSRRLKKQGFRTATGKTWWDRSTVWEMLKNPAYKGSAGFGKTRTGERRSRPVPQRGHSKTPRRSGSTYDTSPEDWLSIPVPAIVDEALFETVQEQLDANRKQASERKRGARYLLQGLVKCACCGYACYGKKVSRSSAKGKVAWAYYRCVGTDAYRFGGQRVCDNKQVRTDKLDEAVWNDVCQLLKNPDLLREEYHRRLASSSQPSAHALSLKKQVEQSRRTVDRLIDAYSDGVITRDEFDARIQRARTQLSKREAALAESGALEAEQAALQESLQCLGSFALQIEGGLDQADWQTRREILRTAIERIEIEPDQIRITYRINFPLFLSHRKSDQSLHFRWRRNYTSLGCPHFGRVEDLSGADTRFEPAPNHPAKDRDVLEDHVLVNFVEEALDVGAQDPAAPRCLIFSPCPFGSQTVLDCHNSIVYGTPRTETERVRFKDRFPFGLQGQFHETLQDSVFQGRNAQRSQFAVRFGNEHAADRQRLVTVEAQTVLQQTFPVSVGGACHTVDAGSFPTVVLLADLTDSQQFGGPR